MNKKNSASMADFIMFGWLPVGIMFIGMMFGMRIVIDVGFDGLKLILVHYVTFGVGVCVGVYAAWKLLVFIVCLYNGGDYDAFRPWVMMVSLAIISVCLFSISDLVEVAYGPMNSVDFVTVSTRLSLEEYYKYAVIMAAMGVIYSLCVPSNGKP